MIKYQLATFENLINEEIKYKILYIYIYLRDFKAQFIRDLMSFDTQKSLN